MKFVVLRDRGDFPHAFWKVVRPVAPGTQLLGDYGESYWAGDSGPEERTASARSLVTTEVVLIHYEGRVTHTVRGTNTLSSTFVREDANHREFVQAV